MSASNDERPTSLKVDKLTLRFRGLTAVNAVDLDVKQGQIYAVIGPNGAGKTSLFNAITGIYEPTEGKVSFEGRDLQAQPERANYVRWGGVGLAIGLLLFIWVCDVNQLWSAVVKANFVPGTGPESGFKVGQAVDDLGDFLGAQPRIDFRAGRFYVTTSDGKSPFGSSKTRDDALAKRAAIPLLAAQPDPPRIEQRGVKWATLGEDGAVLDEAPTRDVALDRITSAREVDAKQSAAIVKRLVVLFLGMGVGFAAAWAVWRQTRRTPTSVAQRGIARTFQNIRLFQDMTTLENVLVGMDRHLDPPAGWSRAGWLDRLPLLGLAFIGILLFLSIRLGWGEGLATLLLVTLLLGTIGWLVYVSRLGTFTPSARRIEASAAIEARRLLSFVGLEQRADELSKNLPYGDQRRLEIARALATRPRLLLLDEPAAGMNPSETVSLMRLIKDIRDTGVTILLIEHHMRVVMGISDRISVLVYGLKIAEGTPEEIRNDPKVIEAYLGSEQLG